MRAFVLLVVPVSMAGRGPQSLPGMQRPREQERRHPSLRVGAEGPAPVARATAALQDALARRAEQSAAVGLARADAAALDLAAAAPAVARGRPGGERGLSLAVRPAVPPVVVAAARGARGLWAAAVVDGAAGRGAGARVCGVVCLRRKPLFFTRSPGPRLISPPGANWRTGVRLERAVCLC